MSNGSFNGALSPYVHDQGLSENQRWHQEREAALSRLERGCKWVAVRLAGRTFFDVESLMAAACEEAANHYGRELTPDEHDVTVRAARILWSGIVLRSAIAPARVLVTQHPATVTFSVAA